MTKVLNYVSTRPRVILGATRAASAEQGEIRTSADTLKQDHERLLDGKCSPHRNCCSPLSPSASQSPPRRAGSVIPQLDTETQHLEPMLMGVSSMEGSISRHCMEPWTLTRATPNLLKGNSPISPEITARNLPLPTKMELTPATPKTMIG